MPIDIFNVGVNYIGTNPSKYTVMKNHYNS